MDHIMVATDLSERSEPAVQRAVLLANMIGAKLAVHYVVDSAMPPDIAKSLKVQATQTLREQMTRQRVRGAVEYEILIDIGDVVDEINRRASQSGAKLLLLGVHRHRVFLDQMRETTMERLIRTSSLPTLLVTRPADRNYTHVMGGLNFSRACASAIGKARDIAPDAQLSLFHAHKVSLLERSQREFERWRAIYGMPDDLPEPIYFEGDVEEAIEDITTQYAFDLLALGGQTRGSLGPLFNGGVRGRLIRKPPCDILVAK